MILSTFQASAEVTARPRRADDFAVFQPKPETDPPQEDRQTSDTRHKGKTARRKAKQKQAKAHIIEQRQSSH
jgi:hypothetical protein